MSAEQSGKTRQMLAHARPLWPLLAVALAVLAVWLAWSGWQQMQDESRRGALGQARDGVAHATARSVGAVRMATGKYQAWPPASSVPRPPTPPPPRR